MDKGEKVIAIVLIMAIIATIIAAFIQDMKDESKDKATIAHLCFPYQVVHSFKQDEKWVAICRSEDGGLVIKQ